MEKIIINPEGYKEQYIKNLNECFKGWGGKAEYQWVFSRQVGNHDADILLIENEEDGGIAGSGVSYRKLATKENSIEIGIMTGSWTLPAARRKGCFTKMINCSKELCKKKNVSFLTAFVTETNASCRRLESEGSYLFPTYHLFSPEIPFQETNSAEAAEIEKNEEVNNAIYNRTLATQAGLLNFTYTTEEFIHQYLKRIKETIVLKINDDYAILEEGANEVVKILLLTHETVDAFKTNMKAVVNWCIANKSKKAFYFTTREELFTACTGEMSFENLPGYFTILKTSDKNISYKELFESLNINMADKM